MFKQSIKMSFKAISSNKARSFLTMLGIIIGVMSLVVLVSLASGATGSVNDSMNSMGKNVLTTTIMDDKGNPMVQSDIDEILEACPAIYDISPYLSGIANVKNGSQYESVSITGVQSNYFDVKGVELIDGRNIIDIDDKNGNYVIIIDENTANLLFNSIDVIGNQVYVNGYDFTVIGLIESASDDSYTGIIPFNTMTRIGLSESSYKSFYVDSVDQTDFTLAKEQLEMHLTARFSYDDEAFRIMDVTVMLDAMNEINSIMMILLGGIASISLVVGGIGIMNIMLVSVTERTKEIGIRKAIGAPNRSILLQFMLEALVISLLGGFIGLILSFIILQIATVLVSTMTFTISGSIALIAIGFSVFVGVVFGLYPAYKAAKKPTIEALRHSV